MDGLSILRSLLRATSSQRPDAEAQFPSYELRFVLESKASEFDLDATAGRVADLLGSGAFVLRRLDPDTRSGALARFAALAFPYIERTLAPRYLYSIAYALADALELRSVEPDLGADYYRDPEPAPLRPGVEAAAVSGLCWVSGEAPGDHRWALQSSGIAKAWTWAASRGQNVRIGQPDTGVSTHDELAGGMLRLDLAWNFVEGVRDPTDPLDPGAANPGHGLSTASVAASRESGRICGAAPLAELVPIRCTNDVKIFNAAPLAAAIAHAKNAGCHVISMSLGGIPSRAVRAAIKDAIAHDMIVVAAAGNCVRTVVWPARYKEVIAVAGTNIDDKPWKGSCRGGAVDISAPAEFVWRAKRSKATDPADGIEAGQGTSFATALTAGIAALWIAHHGHSTVVEAARLRKVSVQDLFRSALKATARPVGIAQSGDFGAGIVDADELLKWPLAGAPLASSEAAPGGSSFAAMLSEEIAPADADPDFDWRRYDAELANIALSQARRGRNVASIDIECKTADSEPSPELAEAVDASNDARLKRFGVQAGKTSVVRPGLRDSPMRESGLSRAVSVAGTQLESAGAPPDDEVLRDWLKGAGRVVQLDRIEKILAQSRVSNEAMRQRLLDGLDRTLTALGDRRRGDSGYSIGLEALVRLTGRPALRVAAGHVDFLVPKASEWSGCLLMQPEIDARAARVGRIDAAGRHIGTGFVVAPGLVLTNRHVAQHFAAPLPRRDHPSEWLMLSDRVTIDFSERPDASPASSRFKVTAVVDAGYHHISDDFVVFDQLDAALLAVESVNPAGAPLPTPLPLDSDPGAVASTQRMAAIGYPAPLKELPTTSQAGYDLELVQALRDVFDTEYGCKYFFPGEIITPQGGLIGDTHGWVCAYDATTLPGCSGSPIMRLTGTLGAVGLHFAGEWRRANYAHALAVARRHDHNVFSREDLFWVTQ